MARKLPFSSNLLFYDKGQFNIAICRMAMALALFHSLVGETSGGNYVYWSSLMVNVEWIPKGLAKVFFPDAMPEVSTFQTIYMMAIVSISMMFLGLFSRISAVVATLTTLICISVYWSPYPYWSHASNVVLLAALAFMLGRSGDRLSIDSLIRKVFKRPDPVLRNKGMYWWPVLLAELATHLFMFGAFYSKFTNGDGIWWAWSDNLRNSIGVTWGLYRFEPVGVAEFLVSAPWAYKTAGTLQLIAQSTTIFAIFFVRRPILRAIIGGGFFMIEIIGLGRVFEFWHPAWMMLCLLSIDFEYFYGRIRAYVIKRQETRLSNEAVLAAQLTPLGHEAEGLKS